MFALSFTAGFVALSLFYSPVLKAEEPPSGKTIEGFAALRSEVLALISGASQRVWLTTDFLSDGEIASALYIAKYRRLQVQVLLGRLKANHFLSRLNYLRAQKIPVFLTPTKLPVKAATLLLIDNRGFAVDGEMDYQIKFRKFQMRPLSADETAAVEQAFANATMGGIPIEAKPLPLVGRPRKGGSAPVAQPQGRANLPRPAARTAHSPDGSYRYDLRRETRPDGVPERLPKTPVWEERQQNPEVPSDTQPPSIEDRPNVE